MKSIKNNLVAILIIIIITVTNLFLTSLPLLNLLHYESAALNGILFSLLAGVYWLTSKEDRKIGFHFIYFSVLILIPLIILLLSTLLCQKCPVDDGLWFYLIITVPSIPVGIALANFTLFISKKIKYPIFLLFWLIMLFGFLPELYFNPQIYFYNPIFGYYPGVIYDHSIEITSEIILYRLINTALAIIIIYFFSFNNNFKVITKLIIITAVISSYLRFDFVKSQLNLLTDIERIQEHLKAEYSTPNFKIFTPDSLNDSKVDIVKFDHEYYYEYLKDILKDAPEGEILSFLFSSGAQKKQLFGSGNADVAKPWLNQIYLEIKDYDRSLKHEIAHIFSSSYGKTPFKVPPSFNPGLIEGFAMALENNYDDKNIDYLAALAYNNGFKISLSSLFNNFSFFSSASSLSYLYAGSFIKYLADQYGWDKIKQIYSGENFREVFREEFSLLESNYFKFLKQIEMSDSTDAANYYFGYRPLIKRICARATAKQLKMAGILFEQKEYKDALEKYKEIYEYSGSYSSLVGYSRTLRKLEKYDKAVSFIENELENFKGTSSYYYLEFVLADLHSLNDDSSKAIYYYEKIKDQNPHEIYFRNATVNTLLLKQGTEKLNNYLENRQERYSIIKNLLADHPLNEVIVQLIIFADSDEKKNEVNDLLIQLPSKVDLSANTYFIISKFYYQLADFQESLYYAKLALSKSDFMYETIIRDHIRKLKWIEMHKTSLLSH